MSWCEDSGRADARAVAVDEIEHAGGHARFVHHLGPENRAEGRVLGRLEHHGAAGGEGRNHLCGHLVHRPVPGRDQRAYTHRLLHQARRAAHLLELESLQDLDHGADVADADAWSASPSRGSTGAPISVEMASAISS